MAQIMMARIFDVPKPVSVTISGTGTSGGTSTYASATVNGTQYTAATTDALLVMPGDTISLFVKAGSSALSSSAININGTKVATATSTTGVTYDWTVPGKLTSITISLATAGTSTSRRYGTVSVVAT